MKRLFRVLAVSVILSSFAFAGEGDWPQWRGPGRSGAAVGGPVLAASWPKEGPVKLWESQKIPCEGMGGFASPTVADGGVFLFVAWKRHDPIPTRTLSAHGLRELGWPGKRPPEEMTEAIEEARLSAARKAATQPGQFAKEWVAGNLSEQQRKEFGDWAVERLEHGDKANPLDVLEKLVEIADKEFPSQDELENRLRKIGLSDEMKKAVMERVPTTVARCNDTIVCLDAASGKTLWKREYPGQPMEWGVSGSVAVVGGKCYAVGTAGVYCVKADDGEPVWKLQGGGTNSSVLVVDGVAVAQLNGLTAIDAEKGAVLWTRNIPGGNNSPACWRCGEKTYVVCNTEGGVHIVDLRTGELLSLKVSWQTTTEPASAEPAPKPINGGGASSPAVDGNCLLVLSDKKEVGLTAYELVTDAVRRLWTLPVADQGCSPILHDGRAYAHVGGRLYCLDAGTGRTIWNEPLEGPDWNSPIVAGGRLFAFAGGNIVMIDAAAPKCAIMGKAKVGQNRLVSPAVAEGRLFVRTGNGVTCYDLADKAESAPEASVK